MGNRMTVRKLKLLTNLSTLLILSSSIGKMFVPKMSNSKANFYSVKMLIVEKVRELEEGLSI